MTNRIVIVGAGFAGFWAALAARRVAPPQTSVALVSRDSVLQIRPRLYEAEPERLGVDVLPLLQRVGVEFIGGDATGLDHIGRTLGLEDQRAVTYARLIVATGSTMRRPALPGAEEAYSVDTMRDAIGFDKRLGDRIVVVWLRPEMRGSHSLLLATVITVLKASG